MYFYFLAVFQERLNGIRNSKTASDINYNLKRVFPLLFCTVEALADRGFVEHAASPPERVMLLYDFK